jgi:hypothetical protein
MRKAEVGRPFRTEDWEQRALHLKPDALQLSATGCRMSGTRSKQ